MPTIRQESLADVFGECNSGIAVDGNICSEGEYKVVTGWQVSKLTVVVVDLGRLVSTVKVSHGREMDIQR